MTDVDLGAVDACPLVERCENCGAVEDLDVATASTPRSGCTA